MNNILTVSDLTQRVKQTLEGSLPYVWVKGQVSSLSRPSSGHLYFTLKDEDAALAAVWFKGSQNNAGRFDPMTGEVYEDGPPFLPEDIIVSGQEVVCAGRLTVYPARGVYQLVVDLAQKAGLGRLHEEFERLKARLQAAGYFAQERKRPLPRNPARVALITSPGGAALHDFLRLAGERGLGSRIVLYPAPVQGAEAPQAIINMLEQINREAWADVIVIIRGGGSLEDLWAFNSEALAGAIFASRLPVLAGIGHEVDFTLADLTADQRAATPSHAAQLLWTERRELAQRRDELELALQNAWQRNLRQRDQRLEGLERALRMASPQKNLQARAEKLEGLARRLELGWLNRTRYLEQQIKLHEIKLEGLNPMRPLERGYALARTKSGDFLRSKNDAHSGDELDLLLADGVVEVVVS